jgi:hypothetical protein
MPALISIEEAIVQHLRADPVVTADVGARIYGAGLLDQGVAMPAITFQRVSSGDDWQSHQGSSGLERARFQFTVYGARHCDAVLSATHLINAMDGKTGWLPGVSVGRCSRTNRTDLGRDRATMLYAQLVEFYMVYRP